MAFFFGGDRLRRLEKELVPESVREGGKRPQAPRSRFVDTKTYALLRGLWPWASLLIVIVGVAAGEIVVALVAAAVFIAGVFARWWGRASLERLTVARECSLNHGFVGETLEYTIRIENKKLLPLPWLQVRLTLPEVMEPRERRLEPSGLPRLAYLNRMTSMRWYERLNWRYQIPLTTRGYYVFGETRLQAGDLFGFFRRERLEPSGNELWVYPEIVPLERLGIPRMRPHGDFRGGQRLFEDFTRLQTLRDYQPGDPLKRVDWKATAKRQQLQSRVYDPSSQPVAIVALNVSTLPEAWQGYYGDVFERAVSVAASLASAFIEERVPVGVLANCTYPGQDGTIRVPAGRAPGQLTRILEALAMADVFTLVAIDRLLDEERRRLPFGSTVALVTAVVTPALEAAIARLWQRGIGVAVVYAGIDDPPAAVGGAEVFDLRDSLRELQFVQTASGHTWTRAGHALVDEWDTAPGEANTATSGTANGSEPAPANPWARPRSGGGE